MDQGLRLVLWGGMRIGPPSPLLRRVYPSQFEPIQRFQTDRLWRSVCAYWCVWWGPWTTRGALASLAYERAGCCAPSVFEHLAGDQLMNSLEPGLTINQACSPPATQHAVKSSMEENPTVSNFRFTLELWLNCFARRFFGMA